MTTQRCCQTELLSKVGSSQFFYVNLSKLLLFTVVLGGVCLLSVFVGAKNIAFDTVLASLTSHRSHSTEGLIVLESRIPRTVVGLFVGAALAVAGSLIQTLTRNPLADPGILGVNSGASFSVILGIVLFGHQTMSQHVWFAFGGAVVTSLFVYFVGTYRESKVNPLKITLAGVAIGALLAGISSSIALNNLDVFDAIRFWDAGSIDVRDLSLVSTGIIPILSGLIIALTISSSLDTISLGEDIAKGLGTNVELIQVLSLIAIALLCGTATAIAGPIGFIGLMIPHLARRFSGPHQLWLTLYCIVFGPILLLGADIIGRVIAVNEIRVSIVTAFVGAPVLILLARKVSSFGKI